MSRFSVRAWQKAASFALTVYDVFARGDDGGRLIFVFFLIRDIDEDLRPACATRGEFEIVGKLVVFTALFGVRIRLLVCVHAIVFNGHEEQPILTVLVKCG